MVLLIGPLPINEDRYEAGKVYETKEFTDQVYKGHRQVVDNEISYEAMPARCGGSFRAALAQKRTKRGGIGGAKLSLTEVHAQVVWVEGDIIGLCLTPGLLVLGIVSYYYLKAQRQKCQAAQRRATPHNGTH